MQINIVRPFMPDLAELSADFAQCLQTGMVTNNSLHVRQVGGGLRHDQRAGLTHKLKPVFCDDAHVAQV